MEVVTEVEVVMGMTMSIVMIITRAIVMDTVVIVEGMMVDTVVEVVVQEAKCCER